MPNVSDVNVEIATTILNQLGGKRFTAMTGAKNFTCNDRDLNFRLPARFAKNNINYVKVQLTPMDVYTVTFSKIHGTKVTQISQFENVYCDQLRKLFETETGLYTSL